jgi:hypothetical protein
MRSSKPYPKLTGRDCQRFDGKRAEARQRTNAKGCWLWSGKPNRNGYGVFGAGTARLAHKQSYTQALGKVPAGMVVRHTCDERLCVRPEHLLLGTTADNSLDMVKRGRGARQTAPRPVPKKRSYRPPTGVPLPKDWARFEVKHAGPDADGCRLWQASAGADGYGRFHFQGRSVYAHIFAFRLAKGRWPKEGLDVAHTCGNGLCVSGEHLEEKTRKEHGAFDAAKGRRLSGHVGNRHRARFVDHEVLDIRARLSAGETTTALASELGMSGVAIGKIGSGESYAHVGGPLTRRGAGRPRGESNARAKLTHQKVVQIRERAEDGAHALSLAKAFGVSRRNIDDIVKRRTWKDVPQPTAMPATPEEAWSALCRVDLRRHRPLPGSDAERELVGRLLAFHRKRGFPYVVRPDVAKALTAIDQSKATIRGGRIGRSTAGMGLATSFHPAMESVRCRGLKTPEEAFADGEVLRSAMVRLVRSADYITPAKLRKALHTTSGVQAVSNFQPVAAKLIYERFAPMETLDLCAGWGGRMLGAMAAGVRYVGIDACWETTSNNTKLLETVCSYASGWQAELLHARAESVLGTGRWQPDLVFTSPPYFDAERYAEDEFQSCVRYPTLEAWRASFLGPCVAGSFHDLRPGGHLVLNIATDLVPMTTAAAAQAGFDVLDPLRLTLGGRQTGRMRSEPVMVFRKPRAD